MTPGKLDSAITSAVARLHSSERGRQVTSQLHELFTGPAAGLDSGNQHAVALLVLAFCKEGRRDFAHDLKTEEVSR